MNYPMLNTLTSFMLVSMICVFNGCAWLNISSTYIELESSLAVISVPIRHSTVKDIISATHMIGGQINYPDSSYVFYGYGYSSDKQLCCEYDTIDIDSSFKYFNHYALTLKPKGKYIRPTTGPGGFYWGANDVVVEECVDTVAGIHKKQVVSWVNNFFYYRIVGYYCTKADNVPLFEKSINSIRWKDTDTSWYMFKPAIRMR